jgi:hypothetical protein
MGVAPIVCCFSMRDPEACYLDWERRENMSRADQAQELIGLASGQDEKVLPTVLADQAQELIGLASGQDEKVLPTVQTVDAGQTAVETQVAVAGQSLGPVALAFAPAFLRDEGVLNVVRRLDAFVPRGDTRRAEFQAAVRDLAQRIADAQLNRDMVSLTELQQRVRELERDFRDLIKANAELSLAVKELVRHANPQVVINNNNSPTFNNNAGGGGGVAESIRGLVLGCKGGVASSVAGVAALGTVSTFCHRYLPGWIATGLTVAGGVLLGCSPVEIIASVGIGGAGSYMWGAVTSGAGFAQAAKDGIGKAGVFVGDVFTQAGDYLNGIGGGGDTGRPERIIVEGMQVGPELSLFTDAAGTAGVGGEGTASPQPTVSPQPGYYDTGAAAAADDVQRAAASLNDPFNALLSYAGLIGMLGSVGGAVASSIGAAASSIGSWYNGG